MKSLFDRASAHTSRLFTQTYSTSFSAGIRLLSPELHRAIYGIYGFVRVADEIVDTFHEYDKSKLLKRFRHDTFEAIADGISLNPVLQTFQATVGHYQIPHNLIHTFLDSMEMDLEKSRYSDEEYRRYILGSAEAVGLMCLKVFTHSQPDLYEKLTPHAMKLGSAFQKVNFLRDARHDFEQLGRVYFPGVNLVHFSDDDMQRITTDIEAEFQEALQGIRQLPKSSRRGVYLAYIYYRNLFEKIRNSEPQQILKERIRISNGRKFGLMFHTLVRHTFNLI